MDCSIADKIKSYMPILTVCHLLIDVHLHNHFICLDIRNAFKPIVEMLVNSLADESEPSYTVRREHIMILLHNIR